MLCRWSLGREDAANAIEAAVADVLAAGVRTRDLVPGTDAGEPGSDGLEIVGTSGMARAIGERIAIRRPVAA
jgi:hypothetical protein